VNKCNHGLERVLKMLTLYFSGTGNTKFIAELFSNKMGARCLSIEDDADFSAEINANDTIAFCYPIYCSRVPRNMREFADRHMSGLIGKKVIILVTQMLFSGDGARVFTDLFDKGAIDVIYAEHFNMQQNMGNAPIFNLSKPTAQTNQMYISKAETKMNKVCENIKKGIVKKRGFALGSVLLGKIQGVFWQKNTKDIIAQKLELKCKNDVKIHNECTACGICTKICPMNNLVSSEGQIHHQNNCVVCYRCVNRCPHKAITVFIHTKPRWQYNGMGK